MDNAPFQKKNPERLTFGQGDIAFCALYGELALFEVIRDRGPGGFVSRWRLFDFNDQTKGINFVGILSFLVLGTRYAYPLDSARER